MYRRLQQFLDRMPVGFPPTKSGVELRILRFIFDSREAEIAMKLGLVYETVESIYRRMKDMGITVEQLEQSLDKMVSKGGINFKEEGGKKYYSAAPFVIGSFEYQLKRLTPKFVADVKQYEDEAFAAEFVKTKISMFRTVPVELSITPKHYVPRYEDLRSIIDSSEEPIAIAECVCRNSQKVSGTPCKRTSRTETCMIIGGNAANLYMSQGWARQVSKQEALEILRKNEEDGLVLQAGNMEKPVFICSCCQCCCGVLDMVKRYPKPVEVMSSNYYAQVDSELCDGCEKCVERCPMDATSMVKEVATVNLERCIGCGVCVPTCEAGARSLVRKERPVAPPRSTDELMLKIFDKKREMMQKSA